MSHWNSCLLIITSLDLFMLVIVIGQWSTIQGVIGCLLIEAMDSVEVDDKQMKDQPPETEK